MTDQEHLERAYRRLLAWYPREFRHENEQEILAVLIAGAPRGQRPPRPGRGRRPDPQRPVAAAVAQRATLGAHGAGRRQTHVRGPAVSTVNLVILLALIGDQKGSASWLNTPFIPVSIAWSLAPLALWLWMARETGRGRNWARIASTVLFGAATLDLTGPLGLRESG